MAATIDRRQWYGSGVDSFRGWIDSHVEPFQRTRGKKQQIVGGVGT